MLLNASMALNRRPAGDERRWERRLVDVSVRVVADDPTGTGVIALEVDGNSIPVGIVASGTNLGAFNSSSTVCGTFPSLYPNTTAGGVSH
jgi:hypothetical protein